MRSRIIIITLILSAIAVYIVLSQQDRYSSVEAEEISFAFVQPENVTKIFIARKNTPPVTLEKSGDKWTVNGSYPAWQKKVDFLLYETLPKIKVKGPAPKAARQNVISKMAVTGIKVEIYTENPDEPALAYYVGQPTSNMMGTYFWKEGVSAPYVVYIPGLEGYLTPRYIFNVEDWISRTIFSEPRENIKRISVEYPGLPDQGFEIEQKDSVLEISTSQSNPTDVNISAIRSYINHFERLNFEGFAEVYADSVVKESLSKDPFVTIELENKQGEKVSMSAYYLPSYEGMHGLYDKDGNMLQYDPNRFLAVVSNMKKNVVIQDYTFRKVFVPYEAFLLSQAQRPDLP